VDWIDSEWGATLKYSLCTLWGMYHDSNSARIDENIMHAELVKELAEEKNKLEKKYSSLLDDVHKLMDKTEEAVYEQNVAKMNEKLSEDLCEYHKVQA